MSIDERFIELWNDYLEGELDESGIAELRALARENERLLGMAADSYQMHRLLGFIAQDSASRQEAFVSETLARLPADDAHFVREVMQQVPEGPPRRRTTTRMLVKKWRVVIAAAAVVVLIAGVYFLFTMAEPEIARITELSGSIQWTGDGGRVIHDIEVGTLLRGGTLESLSADSWSTLAFRDGSTVTISGQSMLTISERESKELYLRVGSLSASVLPQPKSEPMLIHTPTARLEVLGTRLALEAEPASTILRVNEGRVRVTRLVDGSVADVPAKHQVVASANRMADFSVTRRPEPVSSWQSSLPKGSLYGEWLPELEESGSGLRATPMLLYRQKELVTFYVAALAVSHGPSPPAVLTSGGKFRIRGHVESPGEVYFGLTAHHPDGGFAGKYVAARKFEGIQETGEQLDVELRLEEFRPEESGFPDSPVGLILVDWWCCTANADAGLSISNVELIPADPQHAEPEPVSVSAACGTPSVNAAV